MNKYLVATQCGGIQESPRIYFTDYQIIAADTPDEAADIYNKKNNCNYFYASVIMEVDADTDENDVELRLGGISKWIN